ncbi:MAG: ComEA family DNA-binding protein [Gemmatimonadetes bacterium]|nr:ComEA family DNA-binding protein [Gemmatimonadota bacterium]MYH52593.1 ComEA family DNA-binding protein [Gemmatimonadota bacterium]MYK66694.1 ComEA family DNA-binding protein [Gemmatimonadota bacterium]
MTDSERRSMLHAALILGGAALIRFVVFAPAPAEPVLDDRPSIADSLLAAGDSVTEERERRSRPLADGATIDPNVASAEELDRLPGVGASKALRIVQERDENGPFASVEDLARVTGLGPKSVERLKPYLRVAGGAGSVRREPAVARAGPVAGEGREVPAAAAGPVVDLNRATVEELLALPGIGPVMAERIVAFRKERGRFGGIEELLEVKGVGARTFARLEPLLRVR